MKRNSRIRVSHQKNIFVFAVIFFITVACNSIGEKNTAEKNTIGFDTTFMNISETYLPEATGAEAFKMNCVTCHSARYVEMQPEFPRKTWEKIADKMVKSYGAPISDSAAKTIVDYIMIMKGENKMATQ